MLRAQHGRASLQLSTTRKLKAEAERARESAMHELEAARATIDDLREKLGRSNADASAQLERHPN